MPGARRCFQVDTDADGLTMPLVDHGKQPCLWYMWMALNSAKKRVGQRFACATDGGGGCVRDPDGSHTTETDCLSHCAAPVPPGQSPRSGHDLQKFVIVAVAVAAGVALAAGGACVARRRRRGNAERLLPASDATMAGSE